MWPGLSEHMRAELGWADHPRPRPSQYCPGWIVDSEDDDVQKDTEDVDGKAEEDRIFTLWESNTPDKAAQEHQVVDEGGLENKNSRKV